MGGSKSKKAVAPTKVRRRHSDVSGYDSMAWGKGQSPDGGAAALAAALTGGNGAAGAGGAAGPGGADAAAGADGTSGPIATPARGRVTALKKKKRKADGPQSTMMTKFNAGNLIKTKLNRSKFWKELVKIRVRLVDVVAPKIAGAVSYEMDNANCAVMQVAVRFSPPSEAATAEAAKKAEAMLEAKEGGGSKSKHHHHHHHHHHSKKHRRHGGESKTGERANPEGTNDLSTGEMLEFYHLAGAGQLTAGGGMQQTMQQSQIDTLLKIELGDPGIDDDEDDFHMPVDGAGHAGASADVDDDAVREHGLNAGASARASMSKRASHLHRTRTKLAHQSMLGEIGADGFEDYDSVRYLQTGADYEFRHALSPRATQACTFARLLGPSLRHCMEGFNASVMLVGGPQSGKTYTIFGDLKCDVPGRWGLFQHSIAAFLAEAKKEKMEDTDLVIELHVSVIGVQNEELVDVLDAGNTKKLKIVGTGAGTRVEGATSELVEKVDDCGPIMDKFKTLAEGSWTEGTQKPKDLHCCTFVYVKKILAGLTETASALCLAELACPPRTVEPAGDIPPEWKVVEEDYTTLLSCLEALGDRQRKRRAAVTAVHLNENDTHLDARERIQLARQAAQEEADHHVPFRGSTLTRVLAPTLGGCALSMFVVSAKAPLMGADTVSTLKTMHALELAAEVQDHIGSSEFGAEEESLGLGGGSVRPSLVAVMALYAEAAALKRDIERALDEAARVNVSYQGVSEMMEFKVKQLTERLNLAEAALKDAALSNCDR